MQKSHIVFSVDAYIRAVQTYGNVLFSLVPEYGKFYVNEAKLCHHAEVDRAHLDDGWIKVIVKHWFDIQDFPFGDYENEIDAIRKLDHLYPDNVIVVVDKLREYAILNRTYSTNDIYSVEELGSLIKK